MASANHFVDRVLACTPDSDLAQLGNLLYPKLKDSPTWPFQAGPEEMRRFLCNVSGIHNALMQVLAETWPKTILDGEGAQTLLDSLYATTSATGVEIVAATYKGQRKKNEDRILINTGCDFIGVVDAMGGMPDAELTANVVAEALRDSPLDMELGALAARQRMRDESIRGLACCAASRLILEPDGTWTLHRYRKGDCRVSTLAPDTFTVTSETDDEAWGNSPWNSVNASMLMTHTPLDHIQNLRSGSIVATTSDGFHKKIPLRELAQIFRKNGGEFHPTLAEASHILKTRARDNVSIAMMRVPKD